MLYSDIVVMQRVDDRPLLTFHCRCLFLFGTCCGEDAVPTTPSEMESVTVNSFTATLMSMGNGYQATVVADLLNGATVEVTTSATWSTSDPARATVSETGHVTVVAVGTVNIIATYHRDGEAGVTDSSLPNSSGVSGDLTVADKHRGEAIGIL